LHVAAPTLLVLGCKSFDQLCATKLDLSTTLANRLVDVASAMTRDEAIGMGQAKAMAFVDLAAATPEDAGTCCRRFRLQVAAPSPYRTLRRRSRARAATGIAVPWGLRTARTNAKK
jgi:hypothetical protein